MDFATVTRIGRSTRGWSQGQLADAVSAATGRPMSRPTVTKLELGSREPRLSDAIAIAELLGFSLDVLKPGFKGAVEFTAPDGTVVRTAE